MCHLNILARFAEVETYELWSLAPSDAVVMMFVSKMVQGYWLVSVFRS